MLTPDQSQAGKSDPTPSGGESNTTATPDDIEVHKKIAVTQYFDGVAELLESGDTMDANSDWNKRCDDSGKESKQMHQKLGN